MLKYIRYQLFYVGKRLSTYLIPILSLIITIGIYLIIITQVSSPTSMVDRMTSFFYFFPFIFSTIFIGVKILNIFKDGEENGTELLIISKPLKRFQIVLSKFITLYILMILFSLLWFVSFLPLGFIDKKATTDMVVKFASSLTIGVLVIMFLFSSIIILLSMFMGKIGVLSLSIGAPCIFMVISFIISPIGKGSLPGFITEGNMKISIESKTIKAVKQGKDKITLDAKVIYPVKESSDKEMMLYKQFKAGWYKKVSGFDIWQQLYNFFQVGWTPPMTHNDVSNWNKITVKFNSDYLIKLKNGKYGIITPIATFSDSENSLHMTYSQSVKKFLSYLKSNLSTRLTNFRASQHKDAKKWKYIKSIDDIMTKVCDKKKNNDISIIDLISSLYKDLNLTIQGNNKAKEKKAKEDVIYATFYSLIYSSQNSTKSKESQLINGVINSICNIYNKKALSPTTNTKTTTKNAFFESFSKVNPEDDIKNETRLMKQGSEYQIYKSSPFINKQKVITIWALIAALLSLSIVGIYYKKDFR